MQKADLIRQIEVKFAALNPVFDERVRRQWAAAEAMAYGWGGVTAVSCATGLSIGTIRKGSACCSSDMQARAPWRLTEIASGYC